MASNHAEAASDATSPKASFATSASALAKGDNRKFLEVKDVSLVCKWIIISGANSGIGHEAAIKFAKWGADIILACRKPRPKSNHPQPESVVAECRKAADESGHPESSIEWWELDFCQLSSVVKFTKRWLETDRALDILCNNAGIASNPGPSDKHFTEDGFQIIHQVNLLSHVLLTLGLLPSLAKAHQPRILCTNSVMQFRGDYDLSNFNGEKKNGGFEGTQFYCDNKLYFQVWANELQRRLRQSKKYAHITVISFHPGLVASGIWTSGREGWYQWLVGTTLKSAVTIFGINQQQGSIALLHLATSEDSDILKGGSFFNRIWLMDPMPQANDAQCCLKVWQKVNEELDLDNKGLLASL